MATLSLRKTVSMSDYRGLIACEFRIMLRLSCLDSSFFLKKNGLFSCAALNPRSKCRCSISFRNTHFFPPNSKSFFFNQRHHIRLYIKLKKCVHLIETAGVTSEHEKYLLARHTNLADPLHVPKGQKTPPLSKDQKSSETTQFSYCGEAKR